MSLLFPSPIYSQCIWEGSQEKKGTVRHSSLDRNSRTGKLRQENKKFKLNRETLPQSKQITGQVWWCTWTATRELLQVQDQPGYTDHIIQSFIISPRLNKTK